MTSTPERTATVRIDHENYIELQFRETSHKAVDDLILHLLDITKLPNEDTQRILVNSGMIKRGQPISYLLGKLRENRVDFTVGTPVKIAVTFNLMPLASLLEMFVRSLYTGKITFKPFSVIDEARAVDWLLSE